MTIQIALAAAAIDARSQWTCAYYYLSPPSGPLPSGQVGSPYEQRFCAYGMNTTTPIWSVTGTIPPGMTFHEAPPLPCSNLPSEGLLDGTPTAPGSYAFSVHLVDQDPTCSGLVGDYTLLVTSGCAQIQIAPASLPGASKGASYQATFTASGGTPPYTYSGGSLPPGLTLTSWGTLFGVPTAPGLRSFVVGATDAQGCSAGRPYELLVQDETDLLAGRGFGPTEAARLKLITPGGIPLNEIVPYGMSQWGVEVASANATYGIADVIVTGPGPGPGLSPRIRGFYPSGTPFPGLDFLAYGTTSYGVHPSSGQVDGDPEDEIVTGLGSGPFHGPLVRGFDATSMPLPGFSFYAYSTYGYGVQVSVGDVDFAGAAEILTAPGPAAGFGPTIRGWRYTGSSIVQLGGLSFSAFAGGKYGARIATGNVDGDMDVDIVCARGPGVTEPSSLRGFRYRGPGVVALPGCDVTPFATMYGASAAVGKMDATGRDELIAGPGPDPAAPATAKTLEYTGSAVVYESSITAYQGAVYGINVAVDNY